MLTLPKGLHTEIGEKGVRLSGGQRQRLAMARVLITDPRILILDEPTSSLDRETEAEINLSLSAAFAGRTTVIIAHRLWTITSADVVVFLSEGRIKAVGKHSELFATNSEYARFASSQLVRSAEVVI
jgi:ABC-type multidrug transport system fused ATPase/permease subunit